MAKFDLKSILNSQTQKVGQQLTDSGIPWEIQRIAINEIVPSERNIYGMRGIEELAANIEEVGLLHNLAVCRPELGKPYELVSGERRYQAVKQLYQEGKKEWATVPCLVMNVSKEMAHFQLLAANALTRELTDYEKVRQAQEIERSIIALKKEGHKFSGRTRDNVSSILGIRPGNVSRYESIYRHLCPEWMELFSQDKIGISAAYELSCMEEDGQKDALQIYGKTGEMTGNLAKELRESLQTEQPIAGQASFQEMEPQEPVRENSSTRPSLCHTCYSRGICQNRNGNVTQCGEYTNEEPEEPDNSDISVPPVHLTSADITETKEKNAESIPESLAEQAVGTADQDTSKEEPKPTEPDTCQFQNQGIQEIHPQPPKAAEPYPDIPILDEKLFDDVIAGKRTVLRLRRRGLKPGQYIRIGEYANRNISTVAVAHVLTEQDVRDLFPELAEILEKEGEFLVCIKF